MAYEKLKGTAYYLTALTSLYTLIGISAFNHHSCKKLGLESKIEMATMLTSAIPLLGISAYSIRKSAKYFMKKNHK